MSSDDSLLSSLYFTRSTGARTGERDVTFCDAITVGGYPSEQRIIKIVRIEVFMTHPIDDKFTGVIKPDRRTDTDEEVIVGLMATYKMRGEQNTVTVLHGFRTPYIAGVLIVEEDELLVGATGRLKNLVNDAAKNGRLACIEFALYNKETGRTEVRGPYGSDGYLGLSWGSYGPILALEGTVWDPESEEKGTTNIRKGLTTLGFTRVVQGMPEFGILGH